jgi:hypothetical protein
MTKRFIASQATLEKIAWEHKNCSGAREVNDSNSKSNVGQGSAQQ